MSCTLTATNDDVVESMTLMNQESDVTFKFISDMFMEEEDEMTYMPCTLHDCLAYQATQKYLHTVLLDNNDETCAEEKDILRISMEWAERQKEYYRNREQGTSHDTSNLWCPFQTSDHCQYSNGGGPQAKKINMEQIKDFVDLRSLLMACAQAVANFNFAGATYLLGQIRPHSSPRGDSLQRVSHYLANALEARLNGTGAALYTSSRNNSKRRSVAEVVNAYKMFIIACPFRSISGLVANKAIGKLATGAMTLHIVDFGIVYGFQWPSLIQMLSERCGGPPRLRITGIGFPSQGNRPVETLEETGRRLAGICQRYGVPFEYNGIAEKWENISVEDLKIEKDELLVVNCLYWLHNLLDETVILNNPRDAVLKLIKNSNPAIFVHGVSNGQYTSPFFATRFKEAMFHFSNVFDMLEATIPMEEDENRLVFEEHMIGKEAMNVIACEGTERIERPETYTQWQIRMRTAGFRQLPQDQDVVKYVTSMMKMAYHKNFYVGEDRMWLLLGWKGRVNEAISCWQPKHN